MCGFLRWWELRVSGPGSGVLVHRLKIWRYESQRVQVSLWYILIGSFGGLSFYNNDTWTLWEYSRFSIALCWQASALIDEKRRHQQEASLPLLV